jgi:hypothetical protein
MGTKKRPQMDSSHRGARKNGQLNSTTARVAASIAIETDRRKLDGWRERWELAGLQTVPLRAGDKAPLSRWKQVPTAKQWAKAEGKSVNLGVLPDGNVIAVDCDTPETTRTVGARLSALGLELPSTATPSGGRHFWLKASDVPTEITWRELASDVGKGELRARDCYLTEPKSYVDGVPYRFVKGGPESIQALPVVEWRDLTWLLPSTAAGLLPVPLLRPNPKLSTSTLERLKGNGLGHYKSRSEADQAILASLINSGFAFERVVELFKKYPAGGKFRELYRANKEAAVEWLKHSYEAAYEWASTHTSCGKQRAIAARTWANAFAWTGRTGAVDKLVFLAYVSVANRSGKVTFGASSREIAELAGVNNDTAHVATKRLIRRGGMLAQVEASTGWRSPTFELSPTIPKDVEGTGSCESQHQGHDVFRTRGGLGKSSELVWEALQAGPLSVADLVTRSGRFRTTVTHWLKRMAHIVDPATGEILSLVEQVGAKWHVAKEADLDRAAKALGTSGAGAAQKAKHARERAAHAKGLKLVAAKGVVNDLRTIGKTSKPSKGKRV